MSPFSVQSPRPDRALTPAQRRALLAMAQTAEIEAAALAEAAGLKPNGAALAVRALERRGLVSRSDGEPPAWTMTFLGHALASRLRGEGVGGGAKSGRILREDEA